MAIEDLLGNIQNYKEKQANMQKEEEEMHAMIRGYQKRVETLDIQLEEEKELI